MESRQSRTTQYCAIEVERKFQVSDEVLERIQKFSDKSVTKIIDDCYFCKHLALNDRWLRKRNDIWELKLPLKNVISSSTQTTVYYELVGKDVWHELGDLDQSTMVPYAKFITKRKEMSCDWNGYNVQIVIDSCDSRDGFCLNIGEVEIVVNDDGRVKHAESILDQVFKELGLETEEVVEGKVKAYLRQKDIVFHDELLKRGLV